MHMELTFPPCSPPEGDTLPAAHTKALQSLTAAVGNDVQAQWAPTVRGEPAGRGIPGEMEFPGLAASWTVPPSPFVTVPLARERRERQGLTVLASLAKLEKPWLVHKPRRQEPAHWVGKSLFSYFSISLHNRTFHQLSLLWFPFPFYRIFFICPAVPLFEPMMFLKSK